MTLAGSNLPYFRSVQLDFAQHIRNPEVYPVPDGVEPRRMKIYRDLFFNNIRGFIDSTFPVAAKVVEQQQWLQLIREFVHLHGSGSPYFLEICEEFLGFLQHRGLSGLPPFLLELCHYEWIELALDVAQVPRTDEARESGDPGVRLNPVMQLLSYEYPVHKIGPGFQPQTPPDQATFLIAFRTEQQQVRFVDSNGLTHRLLALLSQCNEVTAIQTLHEELVQSGRQVGLAQVKAQAQDVLHRLRGSGIILAVEEE